MNSRLTTLAGSALALTVLLGSCKKDEVQATLTPNSTPTLSASASTLVLAQANANSTAITYTWSPISGFAWSGTDHTYTPAVTYTLQVDKQGNNFATPVNIDAGAGPNTTVKVADLDAALLSLGLAGGKAGAVEVRLRSLYANNNPLYTAAVPLTATPYVFCAQPAKAWGVVGPAGPGWPGGKIDFVMTYDCDAKTYTYTGPLTADVFKFRFAYHWATNLGGSGANTPLVAGGDNLKITAGGNYTVTLYNASDTTKLSTAYYTIK